MIIKPKTLFLIDSVGAFLTAITLFGLLRTSYNYIGMPPQIVTYLSVLATMFCVYSFLCFRFLTNTWSPFLITISIANLFYCCLTLALIIQHFQTLTRLGIAYFIAEIIIICGLVIMEFKTAIELKRIGDLSKFDK